MSPSFTLAFTAGAGFVFGVAAPAVFDQDERVPPAAAQAVADTPPSVREVAVLPGPDAMWQVTIQTTQAGQAPTTTQASLCANPEDLKAPPVTVTGPQCDSQTFTVDGDVVSWTTDCAAVKGTGSLTLAADRQSFSGDVTASSPGEDAQMHVTGVVTGTCTRS